MLFMAAVPPPARQISTRLLAAILSNDSSLKGDSFEPGYPHGNARRSGGEAAAAAPTAVALALLVALGPGRPGKGQSRGGAAALYEAGGGRQKGGG